MNAQFQLDLDDLAHLTKFFPSLKFDRDEQIRALLHSGTRDFQAAPGSGKTTLLGAKLALMAARWPHERRGICILTHTNVAREEIETCLRSVPHGARLLAYPHFIGTIQSAVNRFLAMPWLRGRGIEVREIDDEEFEERFSRRVRAHYGVNAWVSRNEFERASVIRGVRYRGASLTLVTAAKAGLPANGIVIERVRSVKEAMTLEGHVRHDDMFAFAEQAVQQVPGLRDSFEHRFPNVFIDEMQDTSDTQLDVLTKVFRGASVVQRFGDVNQSILCRGPRVSTAAFPSADSFEVTTSLRFGSAVAGVANSVKAVGAPILGEGKASAAPPTLLLYSDATIGEVIERFGVWLAPLFSKDDLDRYPVKAICAIKREGNAKQPAGRHIRDYYPDYDDTAGKPSSSKRSVRELMRFAADPVLLKTEKRCGAARDAVRLMLGAFGRLDVKGLKTWRDLTGVLANEVEQISSVRSVVLRMVLGEYDVSTKADSIAAVTRILNELGNLVVGHDTSLALPEEWFEDSAAASRTQARGAAANCLRIRAGAIEVPIHIATIAAVKGETHLATLVLESCHDRKYDLKSALPYLCAALSAAAVSEEATRSQLMNIFVAASRPRGLLAFAMHADRADADSRAKLRSLGWDVFDWTTPVAAPAA